MGDDQPDGPEARGGYGWASKDEVDSLRIQRQSWAESQIKNETLVISLMQEVHRLRDEMKCVSIPCVFAPCSAHAPASSGQDAALLRVTRMNQMQAFAARRGLGKMRHIETRYLWVQEHLALKTFRLHKVLGTENPADVLTKPQTEGTMRQVCNALGDFEA